MPALRISASIQPMVGVKNPRDADIISLWKETASLLRGTDRRQLMARVVNRMGHDGQSFAEEVLGWNRGTVRKGQGELLSGQPIKGHFS